MVWYIKVGGMKGHVVLEALLDGIRATSHSKKKFLCIYKYNIVLKPTYLLLKNDIVLYDFNGQNCRLRFSPEPSCSIR